MLWRHIFTESNPEVGNVLKEFRAFILRGSLVDLAVAVVIGTAFTAVVTSVVKNIITPIIGIPGKANFEELTITISDSEIKYGVFLNDLISFLTIAAVVFFLVVKPVNALMARRKTEPDVESTTHDCPECLSAIPKAARRCAFCTAEVVPAA